MLEGQSITDSVESFKTAQPPATTAWLHALLRGWGTEQVLPGWAGAGGQRVSPADTWKHGLKSRGQPAARKLYEGLAWTPSREATEPTPHRQGTSHTTRATASRGRFLLKIHPGFPFKWPAEPWPA